MGNDNGNQKERIFIKGINLKLFKGQFGDITKVGVKLDEFIEFAQQHLKNGWINFDIKPSKKGGIYAELDEFIPNQSNSTGNPVDYSKRNENKVQNEQTHQDDVPFPPTESTTPIDINRGEPTEDLPF